MLIRAVVRLRNDWNVLAICTFSHMSGAGRVRILTVLLDFLDNCLLPQHTLFRARNPHHSILVKKALKVIVVTAGSGSSRVVKVINGGKVDLENIHGRKSMSVDVSFGLRVDRVQVLGDHRGAVDIVDVRGFFAGVIARKGTINVLGDGLDGIGASDRNDHSRIVGEVSRGLFGCVEGAGRSGDLDVWDHDIIGSSNVDLSLCFEYLGDVSIMTCLMLQDSSMLTFLVIGRRLELFFIRLSTVEVALATRIMSARVGKQSRRACWPKSQRKEAVMMAIRFVVEFKSEMLLELSGIARGCVSMMLTVQLEILNLDEEEEFRDKIENCCAPYIPLQKVDCHYDYEAIGDSQPWCSVLVCSHLDGVDARYSGNR